MSAIAGQRPLDIGRALDAAIAIYRRYFVAIVAAMAVAVVPLQLLTFAPRPWGLVGSLLQAVVLGGVTPGVATLVIADVRAGIEPAAASVWRRLAPILTGLVLSVALALLLAGASIVLLVAPFLLLIVWFQFVGQVVVVERRRFFEAMGRSRDLVQGSYWRVAGYAILAAIITGVVSGALAAAPSAAASQFGLHLAATRAIGDGIDIVSRVLVAPVQALLMGLLYFDLRLRREGGDIARMLDALPVPAGGAAP
ncbi:MAG: hypothetical protein ABJB93_04515 [Gaiellales bacterium]